MKRESQSVYEVINRQLIFNAGPFVKKKTLIKEEKVKELMLLRAYIALSRYKLPKTISAMEILVRLSKRRDFNDNLKRLTKELNLL